MSSESNSNWPPPPRVPNYELFQPIGRGSYGVVWLARDIMGEWCAIKAVYRNAFGGDDHLFEREFKGIERYRPISRKHESLVEILYVGEDTDARCFYYVMDVADRTDGGRPVGASGYTPKTLVSVLRERGRLVSDDCVSIGIALATALEKLHQEHLVHRDIKPANIIFVHSQPKLADIGLVTGLDATRSFAGTIGYVPPEGPGSHQADVYALGMVLYQMATGRDCNQFPTLPSMEEMTEAERKGLMELNAVFLKAAHPVPASRYTAASKLRVDLLRLQDGESVQQRRLMERRITRLKWVGLITGLVMVLIGLGAGLWAYNSWSAKRAGLRELLVRRAQLARNGLRSPGWSTNSWNALVRAAQIRVDTDLLDQAATMLAGLDVKELLFDPSVDGSSVALDDSGKLVVGGVVQTSARTWTQERGFQLLRTTNGGPFCLADEVGPVQFVVGGPGLFDLQDASTGHVRREFTLDGDPALGREGRPILAISRDGSRVAAAVKLQGDRGRFAVWDARTGYELGRKDERVTSVAFSPDGLWLAVGHGNGRVAVSQLPAFKEVATLVNGRTPIYALAFGPNVMLHDSSVEVDCPWLVAAGGSGGAIVVWDVANGHVKAQCSGSLYEVHDLAFDADGTTLASGGRGQPRLWDVATGKTLLALNGPENLCSIAFSPDGNRLAACGERFFNPSAVALWELSHGRGLRALRGLATQVGHVWWSRDGSRLAALSHNWELAIWDLPTGRLRHIFEVPLGPYADNAGADFSDDGTQLAFVAGEEARLYDLHKGQVLRRWALPRGYGDSMRFKATNQLLLLRREAGTGQERERTWRLRNLMASEQTRLLFEGRPDWFAWDTALPTDADYFLVWGRESIGTDTNCAIELRDLKGNRLVQSFRAVMQPAACVVHIDTRGQFLAYSPLRADQVEVVSLPQGRLRASPAIAPGAISPSGNMFASAVASGGCLFHGGTPADGRITLGTDWRAPFEPAFSPDGSQLAWGTSEGTVLVADLAEVQARLSQLVKH